MSQLTASLFYEDQAGRMDVVDGRMDVVDFGESARNRGLWNPSRW